MAENLDNQRRRCLRLLLSASASLVLPPLLAKGASIVSATGEADAALASALAVLQDEKATPEQKVTAEALFASHPVSLTITGGTLKYAFAQLFDQTEPRLSARVDDALTMPVSLNMTAISFGTALATLLRMARRGGQPVAVVIEGGELKVTLAGRSAAGASAAAPEEWPVAISNPRYRFDRRISRVVLNAYLSRAVSHFGLLASSPEQPAPFFDDDLRMLQDIGAKFIGRCAYAWEPPDDDDAHFRLAAERAARVHAADPEILLQAAVFETAYRKLERIPVPDWVFTAFGLPIEKRNFRYEPMLYDGGALHDHWMHDASVPDMSKRETRLWFYYRARRYIDAGCEAVDFVQVHLMDHNDPEHLHWFDLLTHVREYASRNARRRFVLCDAHTHGIATGGRLLFDMHAFPLITKDIPDRPRQVELVAGYYNSIYGQSLGGVTPSGWSCNQLPYLAEVDNGGTSAHPWESVGFPWVWGVDTISWFAHLEPDERNNFLRYAHDWLGRRQEDGWFQPPTRRVLAVRVDGGDQYQANRRSPACPIGFGQEDAIKALWQKTG